MNHSTNIHTNHKSFLHTSDFICYSLIIVAFILEYLFPSSFDINRIALTILGIVVLLLAWTIIILAKIQFKKFSQKSSHNVETTNIVNTGIFKYSRNPMYLGVALISPAIAFIVDSIWILGIDILIVWLLYRVLIVPEEKELKKKFGEKYEKYCEEVGRWG